MIKYIFKLGINKRVFIRILLFIVIFNMIIITIEYGNPFKVNDLAGRNSIELLQNMTQAFMLTLLNILLVANSVNLVSNIKEDYFFISRNRKKIKIYNGIIIFNFVSSFIIHMFWSLTIIMISYLYKMSLKNPMETLKYVKIFKNTPNFLFIIQNSLVFTFCTSFILIIITLITLQSKNKLIPSFIGVIYLIVSFFISNNTNISNVDKFSLNIYYLFNLNIYLTYFNNLEGLIDESGIFHLRSLITPFQSLYIPFLIVTGIFVLSIIILKVFKGVFNFEIKK